ncbi:hypothetical protein BHYA_0339g00090 [Botrytis hyacinthi]|uniref:Uncharacterized protein n=1 Tax=Botrytis hyacinthi TaxID=278943 RepID=A0A4Z1G8A6_9HELO|nr:hypothetical protein BHYA_0339g00090 [Botrytis hyacinthi]
MNPNHGEDLPLDLKSLSIIIHYDKSCPTDLRQTAHSVLRKTSINDDTFQKHKQKAQLYKLRELMESAKEKLPTQAQMEVSQNKSKKIETAALHPPSQDTTTKQTEKLQQMIQECINHNPLQTQQQAVSAYKYMVAVELRKGMYPGGLPEQVQKRLQMRAQAFDSILRLGKLISFCIAAHERGIGYDV